MKTLFLNTYFWLNVSKVSEFVLFKIFFSLQMAFFSPEKSNVLDYLGHKNFDVQKHF